MINSFAVVPFGILVLLSILYGFNILLTGIWKIKFPASVLGMLLNLICLVILSLASQMGLHNGVYLKTWRGGFGKLAGWILEHYLRIIKPSMNFALKWINVFFIPSFVILPLSDAITFIECLKIAAVFIIGGLCLMLLDVYMILGLKYFLSKVSGKSTQIEKVDATGSACDEEVSLPDIPEVVQSTQNEKPFISTRDDITTIDFSSLRPVRTDPLVKFVGPSTLQNPFDDIAEHRDSVRRTITSPIMSYSREGEKQMSASSTISPNDQPDGVKIPAAGIMDKSANIPEDLNGISKSVAIFVTNYIDWFLYLVLLIVALPLYYVTSIHVMLPFHLGLTVLAYYVAILIPDKFPVARKFAHPILVLTAIILFVCFISSLIYHRGSPKGFLDDLKYYKTGKTYINLFNGQAMYNNGEIVPAQTIQSRFTSEPMWPGCGDFLASLMDISIVSLSLPMFTHRRDFVRNFWVLMPPLIVSMSLTFFCYPIICVKIGISPERSIGFIGRLVTLALGTPLISALGGSVSLMAVCTILSGICGVLVGDLFFALLRIRSDDYVTRGVTLGVNCGAIATAHLLNVDPRAASMSSLSFSVFGTIMIILASFGAVRNLIQTWVGIS